MLSDLEIDGNITLSAPLAKLEFSKFVFLFNKSSDPVFPRNGTAFHAPSIHGTFAAIRRGRTPFTTTYYTYRK